MSTSNGVNKDDNITNGDSVEQLEVERGRGSSETCDNTPLAGFRGFQRVPAVKLLRYDISPYLNKLKDHKSSGKIHSSETDINLLHAKRLAQKCQVHLLNQDLEKLKQVVRSRRERLSSDSSISDCDSSTMGCIKCKICEKAYSSEKKLLKHQAKKHMIVYKPNGKPLKKVSFSDHVIIHEVTEYHKCRKCPKIFEAYNLLKMHMKLQHKKRKCYICNYCNKKFVDRTFFKLHIKLHCDICGLLLPNKNKYNKHRRDICRVIKTHKCKTCDDLYFKLMDVKEHSYSHLSNTCYVCDVCKDQFQSKCAIAHHIAYLHSNSRPRSLYAMRSFSSDRLYLCNFCDESSVERDLIEHHIKLLPDLSNRAMTGYKDYYFCDQCMKNFDTETSMLQHKWTHFLKTSDNSQIRETIKEPFKRFYKMGEVLPESMKPRVILERLKIDPVVETVEFVDVTTFDVNNGIISKKAIVDPKSKKTLLSKYQCQNCGKYYSSNYCLSRHIETQHSDYDTLQCKVCEETFVWPSLLQSHKCIRLNHPEMPFQDARPEIHFDNLHEISQSGFDDLNIGQHNDYLNAVDFEIPAPIVELTEYENSYQPIQDKFSPLSNLGYKVVMQEVPIEF